MNMKHGNYFEFFSLIVILVLTSFCSDNPNVILFSGGTIYTADDSNQFVEAVLIKGGEIEYAGSLNTAEDKAPSDVTEIDLAGKTMLPGFHDVHMHPLEASSPSFSFTLDSNQSLAKNLATIEEAVEQDSGSGWLLGWGHYIHTVLDSATSPVTLLDNIDNTRPIAIMEATSHSVWCNSKALELAGITGTSSNPTGGVIMNTGGEPNGILIDNAGNTLLDLALPAGSEREAAQYDALVDYGLPLLARSGITSFTDARVYWGRGHHRVWRNLADDNQLTARVSLALWAYPSAEDDEQISELTDLYEDDPSDRLRINQIKFYMDGIVQNTTAVISEDYITDLLGLSSNRGVNYFTESRLADYVAALEPVGFDFLIHVIGDAAATSALDAIENQGLGIGRHRLTHLEIVAESDYLRFKDLNVIADMQVAGDFTNPESWSENEEFISAQLSETIIPLKSLRQAGAQITLSSDWDVSTQNPMVGLQNAVTRDPQAIGLKQAIKAYTINAAYAMRQETQVGSIKTGKRADLIILDDDLFEVPTSQINQVQVERTYLDGKLVYKR